MPTYEYSCARCSREFVIEARMSDPAPLKGPNCETEHQECRLQKKLSRTFGYVAGRAPAPAQPPAAAAPAVSAAESAAHICSKYCDQHGARAKP